MAHGLQSFRVDCLNRGEQANTLVDSISSEIIRPLKEQNIKFDGIVNSANNQARSWDKEFAKVKDDLYRRKTGYIRKCLESESILYECEENKDLLLQSKDEKVTKLNSRMTISLREFKDYETDYRGYVYFANQYYKKYKQAMVKI